MIATCFYKMSQYIDSKVFTKDKHFLKIILFFENEIRYQNLGKSYLIFRNENGIASVLEMKMALLLFLNDNFFFEKRNWNEMKLGIKIWQNHT
jgi:hypothetical protein